MTKHIRYVFLVGALLGALSQLPGQTFRGELKGNVEDASGAVLPDARVTATNKGTGVGRAVVTSSTGEFSIPDLQPGVYEVSAAKPGFQEQRSEVEIVVSRVASVNFKLGVASQVAAVEVTAEVAVIETASTTLTGVVDSKTVADLPINGRDFRQMLKLSAGRESPASGYSVNGNAHFGATITRLTAPTTTTRFTTIHRREPGWRLRHRRARCFRWKPSTSFRWQSNASRGNRAQRRRPL